MQLLGDILNQPTQQGRRGAPVRRQSRAKGREGTFWRPTTRQDVRQLVLAARRYDMAGRQGGQRNGPLGHVALEVLDYLANLIDFRSGRLDPALETIAAKINRSKSAVVDALKALRQHGFLDWLRRYVPTGSEGRGPQVQQTSNAYRLFLPAAARRLLGRYGQPAPAPDDHDHARQTQAAEVEAMRAGLPKKERLLFDIEKGPLEAALARLID
ncbi:helix-turn-helix domain-containing protein, partial [Jiella marina]|uniref:helix-turn-helix domain-containing protein n=1 Tax=Jiella sp. LLJ827 TaxID=2917712 RepID=UPI0021008B87